MNMQPVNGNTLFAVKNRIAELQEIIRTTNHNVQCQRDRHDTLSKLAVPIPASEDFAAENAVIAAADAECNALHAFTLSGPYPAPGKYDVDLLASTSISYQ